MIAWARHVRPLMARIFYVTFIVYFWIRKLVFTYSILIVLLFSSQKRFKLFHMVFRLVVVVNGYFVFI